MVRGQGDGSGAPGAHPGGAEGNPPITWSVRAAAAAPRDPVPSTQTGVSDGVGWHSRSGVFVAAPGLVKRERDFARLAHWHLLRVESLFLWAPEHRK